jgi:hypothetical protein
MAKLNGYVLTAATDAAVYVCPGSKRSTVTINICNATTSPALVKVGLSVSGSTSIGSTDTIEYNLSIAPGHSVERTGLALANGDQVRAYSDITGVVIVTWGYIE